MSAVTGGYDALLGREYFIGHAMECLVGLEVSCSEGLYGMSETASDATNTGFKGKKSVKCIAIVFSFINATVPILPSMTTVAINVLSVHPRHDLSSNLPNAP
jgi:hypothetical protein